MAISVLFKLIYYSSGAAYDDIEEVCRTRLGEDSIVNNPKPVPSVGVTVDECTETIFSVTWPIDVAGTLSGFDALILICMHTVTVCGILSRR